MRLSEVPSIGLPGEGCVAVESLAQGQSGDAKVQVAGTYREADAKGVPLLHRGRFSIDVDCRDPLQQRLRLIVGDVTSGRRWIFWLDPYDFPLVNFGTLSRDERFALVLDRYDDGYGTAWLRLAYFPASRSGAKDKPHVAEVTSRLAMPLPQTAAASDASSAPLASAPSR